MAVNNIAVDTINHAEHLYVLISEATRHPFISYDASMKKDRIYLYTDPAYAQKYMEELAKYGYSVTLIDLPEPIRRRTFINYHALGVDEVVFRDIYATTTLDLDTIQSINLNLVPKEQRPVINPPLQLSSIYFLQETMRNVPEDSLTEDDIRARQDLEMQFCQYLAKSRYMVPIHVKKMKQDKPGMKVRKENVETVYVTDGEGKNWIPVFSDVTEFEKFSPQDEFQATLLSLSQLRQLMNPGVQGCILNPRSQAYRILPQVMDILIQTFK